LEKAVKRFIGMFAIALWDRSERTLHLIRDRLGVKPLYWGRQGNLLLFGSELKALRAHPDWTPEINRGALAAYFRYAYVPAPHSIYTGIEKQLPGTIISIGPDGNARTTTYWSLADICDANKKNLFRGADDEAADELDRLIRESVELRMVSDVPIGAFLSGGIDSSTVVGAMQAISPRPVKTFTIGFEEAAFNEAESAKRIAGHLGTDHTELYVNPAEARDIIPGWQRFMTNRSPIHLKSRPPWFPSWRERTSPCRYPATAVTSYLAAMTAIFKANRFGGDCSRSLHRFAR
jgi:asparagine synthase (glutamine-hydrolysing)